jgi:glycosyltransferase involved in cell wall biosynthesis
MPKTLYICYFGLLEPLVQTQVIPYLREILKDDIDVTLLTFEPNFRKAWPRESIEGERKKMAEMEIDWHCLAYHKRLSVLATAYDVLRGTLFTRRFINKTNVDILHARVHIPALIGALARKLSSKKPKLLFDIRGFFPEEYTDAGIWPEGGCLYRAAKRVERWLLKEADGFVVLTNRAKEILFPGAGETDERGRPIEVIPCCVDLQRFDGVGESSRNNMRRKLGVEDRTVLTYVGSFGGWYLTDEMLNFFVTAHETDPSVFVLILTQRQQEAAVEKMRAAGFVDGDFLVTSASPDEIPQYLSAADTGVSFIKRCYSKQASSPTKNAEYLAAGRPIIANAGVGDVDELIKEAGAGVIVEHLDHENYLRAIEKLQSLRHPPDHYRQIAEHRFDLQRVGGDRYRRLYRRLLVSEKEEAS